MATREPQTSERDIVQKLRETLQELPQVHAKRPVFLAYAAGGDRKIDAQIDLEAADKKFTLFIEFKRSMYPRDVREALYQLRSYTQPRERNRIIVLLLAAEAISPGAKELLRHQNVGYYDTGGSLFIPASGVYILIEKPPPRTLTRSVGTLFKGKRSQVLHALLHRRSEWFGVKELAELAKVSPATASETLTALERLDWLASKGQGPSKERRLAEPSALLDEWRKQAIAARDLPFRRYYVPATKEALTTRIAQVLGARDLEYVITQEAAAQLYAPFLPTISHVSCRIAPGRVADAAVGELDARVVTEGGNLIVIETRSAGEFLFKERVGSVWLANPVQVYLDLLPSAGRAQEMAEHLRRKRIGF